MHKWLLRHKRFHLQFTPTCIGRVRHVLGSRATVALDPDLGGVAPIYRGRLQPIAIGANLPAIPLEADVVFRIGAATLVHVEYQAGVLAHHAITLANRHLDRSTLDSIFRRWTTMPLDLSDLPIFQEGRQEGRQEGQVAGAAAVLLRQLERRLGPIGEPRRAAVQRQGSASLDELAVAVLDITTLAQLDAWLTERAAGDDEA